MLEKTDITSRRYIIEDAVTFRAMPYASEVELASSAEALRTALAGLG
jgi:histidine triad (HIT) family protein